MSSFKERYASFFPGIPKVLASTNVEEFQSVMNTVLTPLKTWLEPNGELARAIVPFDKMAPAVIKAYVLYVKICDPYGQDDGFLESEIVVMPRRNNRKRPSTSHMQDNVSSRNRNLI